MKRRKASSWQIDRFMGMEVMVVKEKNKIRNIVIKLNMLLSLMKL